MDDEYLDMSPEEMKELLTEFLTEGDNHLQVLNEKLLQAEESLKNDIEMPDEDLNAMFRAAHTIKGTASFISLKLIVQLTHEMETILQRVKEKEMDLTLDIVDVLFVAFDTLEELFTSLREEGHENADITESVTRIRQVLDGEQAIDEKVDEAPGKEIAGKDLSEEKSSEEEPLPAAESEPAEVKTFEHPALNDKYIKQYIVDAEENLDSIESSLMALEQASEEESLDCVNNLFRYMHTIKGASGIVNATHIQSLAHGMENILSDLRENSDIPSDDTISLLFEGSDAIKAILDSIKKGENYAIDIDAFSKKFASRLEEGAEQVVSEEKTEEINSSPGDQDAVSSGLDDLAGFEDLSEEARIICQQAGKEGKSLFLISLSIEDVINIKSMKGFLLEERLSKKGDVLRSNPNLEDVPDDYPENDVVIIHYVTALSEEELKKHVKIDGVILRDLQKQEIPQSSEPGQNEEPAEEEKGETMNKPEEKQTQEEKSQDVSKSAPQKAAAAKATKSSPIEISTIRVDSHKIDNLMNLSGELVITRARFSQLVSVFSEEIMQQKDLYNSFADFKMNFELFGKEVRQGAVAGGSSDNVFVKKTQKAMSMIEARLDEFEKKLHQTRIVNTIHSLDEVTSSLGKISSDIQSGVMQTRMIPIEGIFTRFKRVVRDISKSLKKDVNLVIEGEDTELDKKIVDGLGDPLTHMIRNAVDHGVEDAETRKANGKSEKGTVFLRASHKGNNICIEVGDDGKGLDADAIAQSAIRKEIVTEEQAEKMNEAEKLDLIFSPGFSTAAKVTNVSGRGVGMDVVKNMIQSVNGMVDIQTKLGEGTTFALKIPLTLAIIEALLVVVGEESFAFPLESVLEIVKISPEDIYSIDGNETVKLRGHALSIVELSDIIHLPAQERDPNMSKKIVVITDGDNQLGLVVDSLVGEDEIVIKSLTEHFAGVRGLTGASILGDGQIALILDPISIIKESKL